MDARIELRLKLGQVLWEKLLQPYFFWRDEEKAHLDTIRALKALQALRLVRIFGALYQSPLAEMPTRVFGLPWRNPACLPGGYDKHLEALEALDELGLGSVVGGTVTPFPQPGNTGKRVFRYRDVAGAGNRYGFNSVGSKRAAQNAGRAHRRRRIRSSIGYSIGKNKNTPNYLRSILADYLRAFADLAPLIRPELDYVEPNISSPNTPGLRDVFQNIDEFLDRLVRGARAIAGRDLTLVLKLPPDGMTGKVLEDTIGAAIRCRFKGLVIGNTSSDPALKAQWGIRDEGGVSGGPLRDFSNHVLKEAAAVANGRIDLLAVGGITQPEHVIEKREIGGPALKGFGIYTGLIYGGPLLFHRCLEAWSRCE